MPARTGNTTYVPGKGSYTRAKSGKAKSFQGKGPAPAGSVKQPEATAATAPTVTVTPSGTTATNYGSQKAARKAVRAQERSARRVKRIQRAVLSESQKPAKRVAPKVAKYVAPRYEPNPSKAVISSTPNPKAKPPVFQGHKTAGTPTRSELQHATETKTLKVNQKGFATTPKVRQAAKAVKQAKRAVAKSQPSVAGLSPEERAVVPLARKAHRKYPDIPVSVLMAQDKQESGFNAAAVSSADAQGLSQFIPSTASSYGVKYGTGPKEKQSQVTGQAHLLHDENFKADPQGALSSYSGGYAAGDYNNPILVDAKASYSALDKPGNPKALKRLKQAKVQAQRLGLKVGAPAESSPAPKQVVTRFKAIKKAAAALTSRHIPYVWGGGHGGIESNPQGLDCSGAVSWVLAKAGVLKTPLTSGSMGEVLKPGPGAVTVFYNAGHTFMKIGNEYWGTSVGDSGAGGLGPHPAPSAAYLAQYNVGHVPGLGARQALQLGIKPGEVSSFPGMTLSSSGTTATINEGAGATEKKPGFSHKPILLTQQQKARQTIKSLGEMGVTFSGSDKPKEATKGVTLAALEKKYGKAAV